MRRPAIVALAVLAAPAVGAALSALACGDDDGPTGPDPVTIDVEVVDFRFEPAVVNASVGDTIRWTQRDQVPHTTTSRTPAPGEPGGFNETGLVEPGDVVEVELTRAGTIDYFCIPHPFMTGSIVVSQ
jgi:plastocyanin